MLPDKKILLLNHNFQVITFISVKRAIKLLIKEKVEVLGTWEGKKIASAHGYLELPATLRLRYQVALNATKLTFSKKMVIKRDNYTCSYCNHRYDIKELTIDHIVPKSHGGPNSFLNCITACQACNLKKGSKSLEDSKMKLNFFPSVPSNYIYCHPKNIEWHQDWLFYII